MLSTRTVRQLLFLSLLLSALPSWSASDEPDLRKEQRLYNNYQRYNLKPTDPEAWRGAIGGKTMTYQIQQADTLWEMSDVLFGDSEFWPKIWSLNAEKIENPHEIFPGQTLHFSLGTLSTPPSLAIAKEGEKIEEDKTGSPLMAAATTAASEAKGSKRGETDAEKEKKGPPSSDPKHQELLKLADIPPEPPPKAVGQFPGSIPNWAYGKRTATLEFEVVKIPRNFAPAEEILGYYLAEQKPVSVGTVIEGEMGQTSVAEYQYISVKLEPGTTQKNLLVVEEQEQILDPVTKEVGKIIQVQGEIEVMDVVNTDESIYRAIVKKIINPIRIGAMLSAEPLPKFNGRPGPLATGQARIVGGHFASDRRMLEPNALVYLFGTGIAEGQNYPIYKQQKLRVEKTKSVENPLKIGNVKVVKVNGSFATAVVVNEKEEIHVGDTTDPHMK